MAQPYVSRADALKLIVEENSKEILQAAATTSVALNSFKTISMGTSIMNMPLLETFPSAQWLTAVAPADVDIAAKPLTDMTWSSRQMVAEEAATIVPIPENVLDDSSFNLWAEIEARVGEAVARLIDQTVFFGTAPVGGVPASFPVGGIVGEAVAKNHDFDQTTEDLIDAWNATMALVEADGYDVNTSYAGTTLKSQLRGLRDGNGNLIYASDFTGSVPTQSVWGVPLNFVANGSWDPTKATVVMGDRNMAVIGMRQKLTAKQLTEATVGGYNLAERDMVALRVKIRLGFCVLVPKGLGQSATPYPFSVLVPPVAGP